MQSGVKLVSETGEALKTIVAYVITVNEHMDAIATSAEDQSAGLAEVNTAVNQIDQVTQQNAAMVEEGNAASVALANEAESLRVLISQFHLAGGLRQTAPVVVVANQPHRPVASPVNQLVGKVAKALVDGAVVPQKWKDF